MQELPVTQVLPEITSHLRNSNRLILQAPPGAGKTTLVPLALLDQDWLTNKQIIMLQPRRLATRTAAARMAQLLGEKVGETVGYQIRQDKNYSDKTRILVVTEGILTRKLQADPELAGVGLVIFDEFHERNLHADLSLAFCLQSQELLNERLKIMLMSATLNTSELAHMLNTETHSVPVVSSSGRSYPVAIVYRPEQAAVLERWNLSQIVSEQVNRALVQHQGNILVFLPGVQEIKQLEASLKEQLSEHNSENHPTPSVIIAPLYGDLTKSQQDQAIAPPPVGQRKVVLATNIAETSLTIEGINIVIDSGLQRQADFDPGAGMNSLHTTMIARDSADQRSGRAGRLAAGTCYRLWRESRHKRLAQHQDAEILRSDLAPLMLELAQWGVQDVQELLWLDQPPPGHVAQARDLLLALQAIDETGKITRHGKDLLNLGIHPRLGHMILTARTLNTPSVDYTETACLLAALLTEKDIIKRQTSAPRTADISYRLSVLAQFRNKLKMDTQTIDKRQCQRVLRSAREFTQRLKTSVSKAAHDKGREGNSEPGYDMTGVLIALAYPDRIARLRNNKERRYLLSNGKGARFIEQDTLANEDFLAIANMHRTTGQQQTIQPKEARILLAAPISQQQLGDYFSDNIKQQSSLSWNNQLQKVEHLEQKTLGRLVLNERLITTTDRAEMLPVLLQGIRLQGLDCLPWSKAAKQLRQRVQFLHYQRQHNPDCKKLLAAMDLPDFSDACLSIHLEQWLLPHLTDQNSIKQLQTLDMEQILLSQLSWERIQQLNELAPEKLSVPSGSAIRIDYSEPQAPFLAVRLQELFGLQQTPAIVKGQLPLLLHLLSPAFRPMQVTRDLASFWKNTYNEVKKELRGKYKKHYWPDDPLQAQATSRAKPRKARNPD